jgi:hypothetical protein
MGKLMEYPPGSGCYIMIIGPSMKDDLLKPLSEEDLAKLDEIDAEDDEADEE